MTTLAETPAPTPPVTGWHPDPLGEAEERYWETTWTPRTRTGGHELVPGAAQLPVSDEPISVERRKAILAERVAHFVGYGYRPESQTETQAVMVSGRRPNHVLHLILSILTLGLWLIVWLIVALAGGEKRKVITVDDYGRTLEA